MPLFHGFANHPNTLWDVAEYDLVSPSSLAPFA